MTLVIESRDYSLNIFEDRLKVTPRRVDGPNLGSSLGGTTILDRITTKYDASVTFDYFNDADMVVLLRLLSLESVSLVFSNPYTGNIHTQSVPTVESLSTILLDDGVQWWDRTIVSFREV